MCLCVFCICLSFSWGIYQIFMHGKRSKVPKLVTTLLDFYQPSMQRIIAQRSCTFSVDLLYYNKIVSHLHRKRLYEKLLNTRLRKSAKNEFEVNSSFYSVSHHFMFIRTHTCVCIMMMCFCICLFLNSSFKVSHFFMFVCVYTYICVCVSKCVC